MSEKSYMVKYVGGDFGKIVIDLPSDVNHILTTLSIYGHEAYVVGGCVRDCFQNKEPHDWDICTSATPEQITEAFPGYHCITTGSEYGTVIVVIHGNPYEITTYRTEGEYSDSRRPDKVKFTKSITEDLKRRDFTFNTIAYNHSNGLIDPYKGSYDAANYRLKCVNEPEKRFKEDPLRILRGVRFLSQGVAHLDEIDRRTSDGIIEQRERLQKISMERINKEFRDTVVGKDFVYVLEKYRDVFAELRDTFEFEQNNPHHDHDLFKHIVNALKTTESDLIIRLAVLFHDIGKPHCYQDDEDGVRHFHGHAKISGEMTYSIMKRLKFDAKTRDAVTQLVKYHEITVEPEEKFVKRWLNKIGVDQFMRLLKVKAADYAGQKIIPDSKRLIDLRKAQKITEKIIAEGECFTTKDLAINGHNLIEIFSTDGKIIGDWLKLILNKVIDGELNNDYDSIIDFVIEEKERRLRLDGDT